MYSHNTETSVAMCLDFSVTLVGSVDSSLGVKYLIQFLAVDECVV